MDASSHIQFLEQVSQHPTDTKLLILFLTYTAGLKDAVHKNVGSPHQDVEAMSPEILDLKDVFKMSVGQDLVADLMIKNIMMKQKLHYLTATLILIAGFMLFAHGSRLIVKTYERESIYIETVKIGKHPVGSHEHIVRQKGMKDGLQHLIIQSLGIAVAISGIIYLSKNIKS